MLDLVTCGGLLVCLVRTIVGTNLYMAPEYKNGEVSNKVTCHAIPQGRMGTQRLCILLSTSVHSTDTPRRHRAQVDVYAYGLVLLEALTGLPVELARRALPSGELLRSDGSRQRCEWCPVG